MAARSFTSVMPALYSVRIWSFLVTARSGVVAGSVTCARFLAMEFPRESIGSLPLGLASPFDNLAQVHNGLQPGQLDLCEGQDNQQNSRHARSTAMSQSTEDEKASCHRQDGSHH